MNIKVEEIEFLAELFDSIERQTFTDFDVVISDHSKDDVIQDSGVVIVTTTLRLLILETQTGRGFQAPNTDCAIENAEGKIIKTDLSG